MNRNASLCLDTRIAERLKALRLEHGWSLEALATRSGVSRATLSRLENGEVSPTTTVLARLCSTYGMTLSRLMLMAEEAFAPLVAREDQPEWRDGPAGFTRRSVSPPAASLAGEAIECHLAPGSDIAYDAPPRPGLEHHLILIDGALTIHVESAVHVLKPGDCLRYRLYGESRFETPAETPARYLLFMV